jgi:hypothetical protein
MNQTRNKANQQQIVWRRDMVLELSSKGLTEREIAKTLNISQTTIHRDIDVLKQQAKQNISTYIDEQLPAGYQKCLAGHALIGQSVKSVWLRFRKNGLPTGPITVNIRKGSDDTVAETIGTFDIQHFPQNTETELTIRNRFNNTYNMVANDSVSVEFPSNATNGFEISTHSTAGNPTNTTSRSHNGTTWSNTADPLCITVKS